MESHGNKPLPRRNQERIDGIARILNENALVNDVDLHTLAHDLGDIEDAAYQLSDSLDKLLMTLQRLSESPRECLLAAGNICGWFDELRAHTDSAEPIFRIIQGQLKKNFPGAFPEP